jgi:hypothetical protein
LDGKVVLFGGEDATATVLGDTWIWDGTTWTQAFPAHSPAPRVGAMAATLGSLVVLFGGDAGLTDNELSDTWVWDGTDWTPLNVSGPSPRFGGILVNVLSVL